MKNKRNKKPSMRGRSKNWSSNRQKADQYNFKKFQIYLPKLPYHNKPFMNVSAHTGTL